MVQGGASGHAPLAVIAPNGNAGSAGRSARLSPMSLPDSFSHSMTSALISIMISDSSRLFP